MKVSRSLKAYWQRQHVMELKLEQEQERKRVLLKQAAKHDIEVALYERRVQQLRLIKSVTLGKKIDIYA